MKTSKTTGIVKGATSISLQKRLVIGLTLGIVVFWLVAAAVSALIVQRELNETFDNAMQATAERILPLAVLDILNREEGTAPQSVASLNTQQDGFSYIVRDRQGNMLLQSRGADTIAFDPQLLQGFATTAAHRLYGATALSETLFLQIAEPLAHRRNAALETAFSLLFPLLFLVPVSVFGIWLFVRLSLRSVLTYRQALETRGSGNLSPIIVDNLPDEITPVADAVNHLIERLRLALEAERRFTANSAHELRTPLATALAQAQRLRSEVADGPLQDRAAQIETSLRELSRLAEKMLQLAKAEGGGLLSENPTDLAMLLNHVVNDLQRGADVPIELAVPPCGPVLSPIDPDAFAILARNLIENALKHGRQGHAVEIALTQDARLTVVNACAVVSSEELAQLTSRFVRGGSRAPGYGLGLAIASTIAHGVGAKLTIVSPATGRDEGFEVRVQFVRA